MRGFIRLLSAGYALAIYGFIFLPVAVLIAFSLQSTAFPIPPSTASYQRSDGPVKGGMGKAVDCSENTTSTTTGRKMKP